MRTKGGTRAPLDAPPRRAAATDAELAPYLARLRNLAAQFACSLEEAVVAELLRVIADELDPPGRRRGAATNTPEESSV